MADGVAEIASIQTKLGAIEKDVEKLENNSISEKFLNSELSTIRAEIKNVKTRLEGVASKVEESQSEEMQKRLLIYGAILTAIGSIVVTLMLG